MKRKRKVRKFCSIVDQHCTAPAGWGNARGFVENDNLPVTIPECSVCGQDVCRNCSYVRQKIRYCSSCFVENFGKNAEVTILARTYRLCGYDNSRNRAKIEIFGDMWKSKKTLVKSK